MTITQAVSERAAETPAVQAKPRRRLAWAVAAVFALMAAVSIGALAYQYLSLSHFSLSPNDERAIRFAISLPENTTLSTGTDAPFPAISPDARNLAFVTLSQGRRVLWLQGLDSLKAQLVPGSEDAHHANVCVLYRLKELH